MAVDPELQARIDRLHRRIEAAKQEARLLVSAVERLVAEAEERRAQRGGEASEG